MDANHAKAFLPLITALAEGKTIQIFGLNGDGTRRWEDIKNPGFTDKVEHYRIKPESVELWLVRSLGEHKYSLFDHKPSIPAFELIHVITVV